MKKFSSKGSDLLGNQQGQATSFQQFAAWSQSLCWLPQEDVHFRIIPQEFELKTLGKRLVVLGMEKACAAQMYLDFASQSLKDSEACP